MVRKHCKECGGPMQRWGRSRQGKQRFYCVECKITSTPQRDDVELRHTVDNLKKWLGGKESLADMAADAHVSRQALSRRFHKVMMQAATAPIVPDLLKTKILIVDGTYIHGHTLCALIAVDEQDRIHWKFVHHESFASWCDFLSSFVEPEIIIMDGQKGLFLAARTLWPKVSIQRCQFHLVAFAIQYIGRKPKEQAGRDLMAILYELKNAKTPEARDIWIKDYRAWEQRYEIFIGAKGADRKFLRPRFRGARLIIRRAIPYLFTFLNHQGAPNTTNLVEGWINGALAEGVRLHRGLGIPQKKALATIILSDLVRPKHPVLTIRERLKQAQKIRLARFFGKRRRVETIII